MSFLAGYLVVINLFGVYMMWSDKRKAKKDAWRTPERNFFFVSLLGGSVGCWIGMYLFHHKTQHVKFTVGIPAILLLQIGAVLWVAANGIRFV